MALAIDNSLVLGVAGSILIGIGFYLSHKDLKGMHELGALILTIGILLLILR